MTLLFSPSGLPHMAPLVVPHSSVPLPSRTAGAQAHHGDAGDCPRVDGHALQDRSSQAGVSVVSLDPPAEMPIARLTERHHSGARHGAMQRNNLASPALLSVPASRASVRLANAESLVLNVAPSPFGQSGSPRPTTDSALASVASSRRCAGAGISRRQHIEGAKVAIRSAFRLRGGPSESVRGGAVWLAARFREVLRTL